MKTSLIVLCLLALLVTSDDVKPADDACTCAKLMSENDCKAKSGCAWTAGTPASGTTAATQGSCATATTPTAPTVATYCSSVTDPATKCASTTGCAYVDSKCTHFTGCTAYVKTTNADCQAISTLCITNGTQCTDAKSCNEYTTQTACEANPSISGIKKCKWDNGACRDYVCTEAASTLTTNADCSAWLSGCVTTGKGCTLTLGACASYTGDDVACGGLKGTDGNCEGVANGTNCKARTCAGAAATLTTDTDCAAYQTGCVTNGKGCVTAPLPACASYSGDNTTCVGYIGSDGTCEGDAGATNCRARICTNAPTSNNTDALCAAYKAGCVTTGKGCIATKGACSSYSGTTTSCVGFIGTDGICKGTNATTASPCAPKVCTDAPTTTNTNAACASYQTGCVTTGKGCVSSLGPCSGYTGTTTTCDGYVGTDGKCKGTNATTAGACAPKVCTEAPASTTTNEACAQYQTGCVTNGAGCVSLTSCINTVKQISCTGTSSCGWNNICVASANCSDFLTVSICLGNNAGTGATSRPCYWTGSACRDLACTDAPTTHNTDTLCNTFLSGCWTKGNGCLAQSAPCSSYQGTQTTCAAFTKKCWNTSTATSTTACTDRTCADDTTSTSDGACNTFKTGCRTKGTGCIDSASLCSAYQGTQAQCDAFRGSNGTVRCWNTSAATATTACAVKACTDNTTSTTDTECDTFLSGCVSNGAGCILKSAACSSYNGTQTQCAAFKGSNGANICWLASSTGTGSCVNKACSHAPTTLTTDADCGSFLAGCLTNGAGCIAPTSACTAYTGTITQCAAFTGNSKKCYKADSCGDRLCADKTTAANNAECTTYLSTCRYFKGACVNAGACTSYTGTSLADCQDVLDNSGTPLKCWWITGGTTCIARTCTNAPSTVASQTDCNNHVATGCMYNGNNQCVVKGTCGSYTATVGDDTAKATNCKSMTDTSGNACWFTAGASTCSDRTCANVPTPITAQANCDAHKTNCQYNGTTCVDQAACSSYTVSGTDAEKLTKCKAMKNTSNKACFWTTGTSCEDTTCANAVAPGSQAGCDTHLASTCLFKYSCETRVCTGKTGASSQADCTSYLTDCQWLGGGSCAVKPANCAGVDLSGASLAATKTTVCEGVTTVAGIKCQLNTAQTACEDRTCAGAAAATATSSANCNTWKANCQWDGVTGCVDQAATCPAAFTAAQNDATKQGNFCENYTTSTSSGKCQINGTTGCQARTCAGAPAATATSSTNCNTWLANCQWDGATGCVDQAATCPAAFAAAQNDATKQGNFCTNYTTSTSSGKCQVNGTTGCQARTCAGAPAATATSSTNCNTWLANCQWDGATGCVDQAATCPAAFTAAQNDATKQGNFCNNYTTSTSSGKCQVNGTTGCLARACNGATGMTSTTTCSTWMTGCQWDGNTSCVAGSATCPASYISTIHTTDTIKTNYCTNFVTTGSAKCQLGTLGSGCESRTCANAVNPTSNTDCSNWLANCVYTGSGCVAKAAACTSYTPTGATNDAKRTICTALTSTASTNNACVYVDNSATCADKACGNVYPTTITKASCEAWLTTCRYVGTTCQNAAACNTLTASGADDATKRTYCSAINDDSATPLPCTFVSGGNCAARTCANIPTTPGSDTDCRNYLSTCRLSNTATATCVDATVACNGYQGTDVQCKTFTGLSGTKPCWSTTTTTASCIDKLCTHNTTATTDVECNEFLAGCKTNGSGCVASNTACSTFTGNSTTCVIRKAGDNTNYCKVGASVSGSCQDKSCYDDASSTTDAQCQAFMSTCLTRGTGCIPNTEPCTTYRGTQTTCAAFTGSSGANKCWNTSTATATTACVNKKCSDDTTSTTDTACAASLTGCVTKGTGCIEKTAACSAYTGTQATCSAFKGNNGTVPCWNTTAATATTACVDKACTHNTTATTDQDCDTFLPKASGSTIPKCVTDGSGCEAYPRTCSQFTGTTDQCGKFTASDGPCKSTVTTGSGPCTPRICTEALNTNNTDALCKAYHPSCVTTGYGCVTSVSCSNVQEQNACTAKTGCSWVNNCRSIGSDCTNLTTNGASICVNTPVTTGLKRCAWYNNACRAVTCQDLSDGLKTDDACKAQLSTCTTKGEGCITKGACSTYSSESICKAAKTTDAGDTCIWDSNACRAKKCTDATTGTTTDDGCNTFLTGCKTNGTSCISPGFNCTSIVTNAACLKDGSNKPCLWVNSVCYNYVKCEDITMTTHSACQAFSPLCTTDGTKCIAISSCSKTSLQVSCIKGTDGTCGWLPANGANAAKCQKFGACTDAVSADKATCQAYGSTCITDGTKCIATGTCSTYTTQIACETGGTDGTCIFSSNACRLRECTDATASNATAITTHAGCYSFSAKTKCTTNGTSCISLSTCSSYTIEGGCELGTDGICTWALPVGTTTSTTKSCRLKVCQDFTLTTSAACSTALTGAGVGTGCVSNGTNCIVKSACATYTTKEACNGGGTDGLCAFTPGSTTTPTVGTCKVMSQCSDANNDSLACAAKSAVCNWKVTTSGSTTTSACNAHDCTTKANGTDCNPVPSFDAKTYSICIPSTTGCVLGVGTSLTQATCYGDSLGTYTWNASTNACTACFTRTADPGTNNPGTGTGSTYGTLLNTLAILLVLATMVA